MKNTEPTCEKYYSDFVASLNDLRDLIAEGKSHGLDDKIRSKIVQNFEVAHDLALNTIGAYFKNQGRPPFSGSRDTTVEAFHEDLIDDGEGWLDMVICRIKYNPLYPGDYLGSLSENIIKEYVGLLENFERIMGNRLD